MTGRFSRLPAAAVTDTALSDKTLRVLAVLGIYADAGGLAYPSIPSVAKHLRMSERQIRRHVRALEAAGYVATERTIRHTRGGWGRNRYFIQYPAVVLPAAAIEDCDEDVGRYSPTGEDPKRTSGARSGNEAIGHPECPVGDERPDIQSVRSGRDFDEATGHLEPSDRTSRVSDTTGHPGCPINSPLIPISPMGNQPKGSRDVFEEMFADLRPALRRQSSVELGATIIETEPAEPKLLGKVTELVEKAEPSREAPQPAEPAVPAEPLPVPPEPKPFDPAQYHNIVADKITRWCGVGIGQAWEFMLDLPDSSVVDLCRKVHDGKLRKADVTKALKAAQALKAQAAE